MSTMLSKLALVAALDCACALPAAAQAPPAAKKAARVTIAQPPATELVQAEMAVIRWTTNNPGGTDLHFAAVYYGVDPAHLNLAATAPIRINRDESETTFRVRLGGLAPYTTYYYRVGSFESTGVSDGVTSAVAQFTTPGVGERVATRPQRP